jgi:Response regulator containing a CheY-like receiver domain and an HTH DNA-binding domain
MVKILLADEQAIIRNGLKAIIEKNISFSIIEEVCDANLIFEKIKANDYQLIILDINMPDSDSLKLVQDIFNLKPDSKILVFTMYPEEMFAKKYLQLGVMGYLTKQSSEEEINIAIDNLLNNKRYVSAPLLESLTHHSFKASKGSPFESLSGREVEILQHLLHGETVDTISNLLKVDISTVGTYKSRIFKKLKCKSLENVYSMANLYKFGFN